MPEHTTRRRFVVGAGTIGAAMLAGCTDAGGSGGGTPTDGGMDDEGTPTDGGMMTTQFTVRVENVSTAETLRTMEGGKPVPLAPVAYTVHEDASPLFTESEAASAGLESLAEDGSPTALVEEVNGMDGGMADAAAVPEGSDEPGPIGPGGAYEFTVEAVAGQQLSLATMFVQSNDLFYAPEPSGIPLFDGETPVDGDRTDELLLWDAGTEVNEEPGTGPNQAPRQEGPDTGPDEGGSVRRIDDVDDGYSYPATTEVVRLTVTPGGMDG
jgi:hypothetical protein